MQIRFGSYFATFLALLMIGASARAAEPSKIEHGRYLVMIGGCNDCHTAGFMEQNLKIPEKDWLQGSAVGFQGPWGTTYAANLRLVMNSMSESQWLEHARKDRMPPMPAYVAPGGKVSTPYFVFVPQVDQKTAAK